MPLTGGYDQAGRPLRLADVNILKMFTPTRAQLPSR
jgi:hypothetical protein